MGTWWFVRHGESEANAGGWLAGHKDVGLTEAGVGQARELAPVLARVRPERVLSSDLRRAIDTALLALDGRPLVIERVPALRERALGAWEGEPITQLYTAGHAPTLHSWDGRPPGGESHLDLARRALAWLAWRADQRDTLVFGHGGLIRVVVGLLDGVPYEEIGRNKVGNVQVLQRRASPQIFRHIAEQLGR